MKKKGLLVLLSSLCLCLFAAASEIAPTKVAGKTGIYSDRTLVLALDVDSEGCSLVFFTAKDRPFSAPLEIGAPRSSSEKATQLEIVLYGPSGETFTKRVPLRGICLLHSAGTDPHVEGDTTKVHRDTVTVELPELERFDKVEVAYYVEGYRGPERITLGVFDLLPEKFYRAAGNLGYCDLSIRPDFETAAAQTEIMTPGTVHWPEEYSDPDIYTVHGNGSEVSSRINVVIVPDGYTYAQKSTMQTHAQNLVNYFRNKTPFKEHDAFMNYILVYAYSTQSGTDQCDCSTVVDTAMNTRFPKINATCGHSDNRCLYYGTGNGGPNCDPNTSSANISAAELRAPADDITLVMVNTSRYGGCGGYRAVYSAGYSGGCPADDIGIHELGHSLAGLADEYTAYSSCGSSASELNTSLDSKNGAWPEWIADIGAPREGADYYTLCIYRPESACEMRSLCASFCRVCNQQWALTFFGHPRVSPTAPVSGQSPGSGVPVQVGKSVDFSVLTRLASGTGVTNGFTWTLQGPGYPTPTVVFTGSPSYSRGFAQAGFYTLTCDVSADTNFVKPSKYGANRETASWTVDASAIPEVSGTDSFRMTASPNGSAVDIIFEDTGSVNYNIYVSNQAGTSPFLVSSGINGKRICAVAKASSESPGMLVAEGVDISSGITGGASLLFFLVAGDNGSGTEGPLGFDSSGGTRSADAYCAK